MRFRRLVVVAALAALLAGACSSGEDDGGGTSSSTAPTTSAPAPTTTAPGAGVTAPTAVEGPIEGGRYGVPYNPMPTRLTDEYGYVEEEWFVSGQATSYEPVGELTTDGRWAVRPAAGAPYSTRILVRRPVDADAFNGTVVVEWLNDSAGRNSDPQFGSLYPVLFEAGAAYVGVSAQSAGIEGGGVVIEVPGVPAVALAPLQEWDPERYRPLDHPGDAWSYDIFSQVAQLVRRPGDVDPLDGLSVEHVLGIGESQGAARLATYINAVQPLAGIYDGFIVHSRSDGAAPLDNDPPRRPLVLRDDLDAPVLQLETETDLITFGFLAARQPDSDAVATWEMAGTAHADASFIGYGRESSQEWLHGEFEDPAAQCGSVNDGPQSQVLRAGYVALHGWVVDGTSPPAAAPIEVRAGDILRDENGNALGGVRTPDVDAPDSALTGITPSANLFCLLFGASEPLTDAQLADLYTDHDDYVAQVTASADAAVEAGFLLPADRDAYVEAADAADVP